MRSGGRCFWGNKHQNVNQLTPFQNRCFNAIFAKLYRQIIGSTPEIVKIWYNRNMEKELRANARKADAETQYEIRKAIIRMLKNGMTGKEIAKQLDVSEGHVSNVKKAYETNGIAGIKPKHQGRKTGEKRILSPQQEKEIMRMIIDKDPAQLRLKHTKCSSMCTVRIRHSATLYRSFSFVV